MDSRADTIQKGRAVLGIEFGSTRIKGVLVDERNNPIATGIHDWENRLENGLWTYSESDILDGLRDCYADLRKNVKDTYGVELQSLAAIGISGMMHGYLAFDKEGRLLVPFRTWRNTNTGKAAEILTGLFNFNIPLRWSIAHLYQAVLDNEPHIKDIASITTLAGYVHRLLTGENTVGTGEASGIFPIDPSTLDYDRETMRKFDELLEERNLPFRLRDILPAVRNAGENGGCLTSQGAALLDPYGSLKPGVPFCPPEGDAGTGMVATNAVRPNTGNVSAGTSSFSMIVLDRNLTKPYEVIDIVTTPDGKPVAMVHCNNCTSDINAWVGIFGEFARLQGMDVSADRLFESLFRLALEGEVDCGGLVAFNFYSGEPVADVKEGRLMTVRTASDRFNLANFMRMHLYSALACLKIGNDVLFNEEHISVARLMAHGGLFRTKGVGQRMLAAALDCPVAVMETAGEGGAWGMAILAAYMLYRTVGKGERELPDYLDTEIFASARAYTLDPDASDVKGFDDFMSNYKRMLPLEKMKVAE